MLLKGEIAAVVDVMKASQSPLIMKTDWTPGGGVKAESSPDYQVRDVCGAPVLFAGKQDGPNALPPVVPSLGYSERQASVTLHDETQQKRNQ